MASSTRCYCLYGENFKYLGEHHCTSLLKAKKHFSKNYHGDYVIVSTNYNGSSNRRETKVKLP